MAFLIVMVPLNAGMVAFIYNRTASLAFEMADAAMRRTTIEVTDKIDSLLAPVGQAVESLAALAQLDRYGLRHLESQKKVFEMLQRLPDVTSLYAGFAVDGGFYQVLRVRPGLYRLGPELGVIPDGANFVMRELDAKDGKMVDNYTYIKAWGQELGVERGPIRYDPRQRAWYKAAMGGDGLTISDVYAFSGTGNMGLTISQKLTDSQNTPMGVVGADLSLQALSQFLEQRRAGKYGVVFIMDENGRLIAHPRAELAVSQVGNRVSMVMAGQSADPVVADAVRKRMGGAGDHFRACLGADGDDFLVAFQPFPSRFGRAWTIGIAAPVQEFVGPIQRASLMVLAVGLGVILTVVLAAVLLSRLLTRPIQALIHESNRIRQFDLAERPVIQSGIIDVDSLAESVDRMKSGLRSFGAYVPKELVRHIIASGVGTNIGGTRRPLTILFSDIKGFTSISEALAPEEVLERLSRYFDVMSHAIHDSGGVVDKFIGDAIMAIWNAPTPDEQHAVNACRALLSCLKAEDTLNAEFLALGKEPFCTRFGLHTGTAVIGNVGCRDRMQYTALGAMVNLASRVESLNKTYGTRCLMTGPVEEIVRGHFLVRMMDIVVPSGTSLSTSIFELVGPAVGAPAVDVARCRRWDEAFATYRQRDWGRAMDAFCGYLVAYPDDRAGILLRERCRRSLTEPPPVDWDGAIRFTSK